jgi:hypothetical protein
MTWDGEEMLAMGRWKSFLPNHLKGRFNGGAYVWILLKSHKSHSLTFGPEDRFRLSPVSCHVGIAYILHSFVFKISEVFVLQSVEGAHK